MFKWKYIIITICYFIAVASYTYIIQKLYGDMEKAGQFGDMFGCFSAVINGLVLLMIGYSAWQPIEQLKLQNRQLEAELSNQKLQSSTHIVSTLDNFYQRWNSPEMLRARHRAAERCLAADAKYSASMQHISEYFEIMGVLVRVQAIDSKIIWDLSSTYIEGYWSMLNEKIIEVRRNMRDTSVFSEFECLYRSMKAITVSKSLPDFEHSKDDIKNFASAEKKIAERLLCFDIHAKIENEEPSI